MSRRGGGGAEGVRSSAVQRRGAVVRARDREAARWRRYVEHGSAGEGRGERGCEGYSADVDAVPGRDDGDDRAQ